MATKWDRQWLEFVVKDEANYGYGRCDNDGGGDGVRRCGCGGRTRFLQDDPGGADCVQAEHQHGEGGGQPDWVMLLGVEAGWPDVPLQLQELQPAAVSRHRPQACHAASCQVQHCSTQDMLAKLS